jgi:hypothetical protein
VEPYLGEDAASGLIAMYGKDDGADEDVSVSHWRYGDKLAARDGSQFSLHHRARLFDGNNQELNHACPYRHPDLDGLPLTDCPEPGFQVTRGQRVRLELTYENAGKTTPIAILARYYLSTDNRIDDSDLLLKTQAYSIKRDSKPSTLSAPLKIPKNVMPGQDYWLGCRIALKRKSLKEYNLNNNAAYLGINIK